MTYKTEKVWITASGLKACCLVIEFTAGVPHHRCGYVEVKKSSPLYGVNYNSQHPLALQEIDVHGGLTYSAAGEDYLPGDADSWWFGFDCAHAGDGEITSNPYWRNEAPARSLEYVEAECESLAAQLIALEKEIK